MATAHTTSSMNVRIGWRVQNVRSTFRRNLVAAGVDVTVIRSWLGHAHLDTTNHYAQASLETKRKALEQVDPKFRPTKPPRWKRDTDLLGWLDSLVSAARVALQNIGGNHAMQG